MTKPNEKLIANWERQMFPKPKETGIKVDIYRNGVRVLNAPVMDYGAKK